MNRTTLMTYMKIFFLYNPRESVPGAQEYGRLFSQGYEADRSSPSRAEVNNTSLQPYVFTEWLLILIWALE
jgi:hypothetical protein